MIRPDRGGRSYWNFPRSALESLKAAAQPAHSLRPDALVHRRRGVAADSGALCRAAIGERCRRRHDRPLWSGLARRCICSRTRFRAPTSSVPAAQVDPPHSRVLHPLRLAAVVSRAARTQCPVRPARRRLPGRRTAAEARAAVRASRVFLAMALRHLRSPRSPANAARAAVFIRRYSVPLGSGTVDAPCGIATFLDSSA